MRTTTALFVAAMVTGLGCKGAGGGGGLGGGDEGEANFTALKKPAASDAALGDRIKGRGLSVQAPKGAHENVGQAGDDTAIYKASGAPHWQIAITRDNQRAYSVSELGTMVTANVKDGKVTQPAAPVTIGPGVKAVKIEYDRKLGGQDYAAVLYAFPATEAHTTGMVYQVTYLSDPKDKAALRPLYDKSIQTVALD